TPDELTRLGSKIDLNLSGRGALARCDPIQSQLRTVGRSLSRHRLGQEQRFSSPSPEASMTAPPACVENPKARSGNRSRDSLISSLPAAYQCNEMQARQ